MRMQKQSAEAVEDEIQIPSPLQTRVSDPDPEAEGHGRTRFDTNSVTLSGRVVSKKLYRSSYQLIKSATSFILNVERNENASTRLANVFCKVDSGDAYAMMFEGDMIAVLGELANGAGEQLYVKVSHWHLLEPYKSWQESKKEREEMS